MQYVCSIKDFYQEYIKNSYKSIKITEKKHTRLEYLIKEDIRNSLAVQWLRLHASTAGGTDLIPGQGTKIPHAT